MANELKMGTINALLLLRQCGWSFRRIADELGIHRETVARHVRLSRGCPPKPAKVTTGPERRRSQCEEFREQIETKLEQGLSAVWIHQDLVDENQFPECYESVKRFVRVLRQSDPLPFRRMEVLPAADRAKHW